jgi:hypothetical protein
MRIEVSKSSQKPAGQVRRRPGAPPRRGHSGSNYFRALSDGIQRCSGPGGFASQSEALKRARPGFAPPCRSRFPTASKALPQVRAAGCENGFSIGAPVGQVLLPPRVKRAPARKPPSGVSISRPAMLEAAPAGLGAGRSITVVWNDPRSRPAEARWLLPPCGCQPGDNLP